MKKALATGLLLTAVLLPMLQGCLPMLAAGASGSAMAAFDRRSLGTQTDDETIEWKASARVSEKFSDNAHVNFVSFNRKVLISGEVPSAEARVEIEQIVAGVPQVQGVYNELTVGPVTSFSTRSMSPVHICIMPLGAILALKTGVSTRYTRRSGQCSPASLHAMP